MNELLPDLRATPTKVGNFVIAYEQEIEFITEDIQPDALLHFIQCDVSAELFCGSDASFFPRAVTDSDLTDSLAHPAKDIHTGQNKDKVERHKELKVIPDTTENTNKMEGHSGDRNKYEKSFQPDVIISNSHHRPGPDGSPALLPSKSRGFVPTNLSETGELFAPMRTLTFSDVDQSSQVDDSYADTSRFASTPDKSRSRGQYDYDMPGDYRAGNGEQDGQVDSDSDSDHIHIEPREHGPEFRQLEGEADQDLISSGAFQPSAHGLNQEFMDNFTGRTGNMQYSMGSVFSPLAGPRYPPQERLEAITPPLHVPSAKSPLVNRSGLKASAENHEARDEMQFDMSPTRNPTSSSKNGSVMINRQEYMNSDRFYQYSYPNEHTFEPIDKQPQNFMSQNTVPKNLNEYFEHGYRAHTSEVKTKVVNPKHDNRDVERAANRQGDGYDHDMQEDRENMMQMPDETTDQFAAMSPSAFEKQYLQRTQVSVKLPQATYDTMASNTSYEERTDPDNQQQARYDPPGMPPDTLQRGQYNQHSYNNHSKASPAKNIDNLQTKSLNLALDSDSNEQPDSGYSFETLSHATDDRTSKTGTANNSDVNVAQNEIPLNVSGDDNQTNPKQDNCKLGDTESATGGSSVVVTSKTQLGQVAAGKRQGQSHQGQSHQGQSQGQPHQGQSHQGQSHQGQSQGQSHLGQSHQGQSHQGQSHQGQSHQDQSHQGLSNQGQSHQGQLQARNGKPVVTQYLTVSQAQQVQPAQQPSSRLLQETISKKSKVNHKFVSSNPVLSKAVAGQSKEVGKQQELCRKNSTTTTTTTSTTAMGTGARKTISSESEKSASFKSKSVSMESLNQKQKPGHGQNASRHGNKPDQNPTSQGRDGQFKKDPGVTERGHVKGQQGQRSPGDEHREESHVVTQVQTTSPVSVELTEHRVQRSQNTGEPSLDVRGMEEVRHQLQSMLRLSHDTMSSQERGQYEHSDIVAGYGMEMGDQARQMDASWNAARKPADDVNVSELFPSFSSSQYMADSGNVSRSDTSVHMENQRLRDMVEKERYRRKHCEAYIQQLNVKLLETQQQVAVAVSTDKRKDIMIEQLDKQLAVVMEGWKRRDVEKDAMVEDMRKEKEEIEASMKQQQQMINNFEHDMSQAVDALREEKDRSDQAVEEMKEKLGEMERSCVHHKEQLSAEQEKVDLLQQECDNLREGRDTLDKKLDNMQRRLHREQDDWFQREQELLQRFEEVSEKNTKVLQIERAKNEEQGKLVEEVMEQYQAATNKFLGSKNEEQGKLAEEVMEQYQAATNKIKRLEMDLDAAMREKESVKVEMGIMEAKFENAQRVLEAEMHSTMEKQIADQIADVQARNERSIEEVQEKHRAQVLDLSQRHGRELEKQLAGFRQEVQRKEEDFRKQMNELEARLAEYRTENSELKLSKQKLESTRLEILAKLQYAMQTQWNEAFSLLASTPQRRGPVPANQINSTSVSGTEALSLPSLSFSFANTSANQNTHERTLTNHGSPPRSSANQTHTPEKSLSNQNSPEPRGRTYSSPDRQRLTNQTSPDRHLANQHSRSETEAMKGQLHSTPDRGKPAVNGDEDLLSIETTTQIHMQQFQDYMNSVAQTPEWISTINTQQPSHLQELADRPSPTLPQPPDLAALLASHLQNMQQQQLHMSLVSHPSNAHKAQHADLQMSLPSYPSNDPRGQNQPQMSLSSDPSNPQRALNQHQMSLPSDPTNAPRGQHHQPSLSHNSSASSGSLAQPKTVNLFSASHGNTTTQTHTHTKATSLAGGSASHSEQHAGLINQSNGGDTSSGWSLNPSGRGISYGDAHDLSCAVPIRPPQQGEDPYLHDDDQSVISSIIGSHHSGYFQGGQSFSPPTKQSRVGQDDSMEEEFIQHTSRLNEDYNHLSERMEQHESHQNDLQHYIQMLLNKPASEAGHDDSLYSQDQEDMDLNDTAQAAQLQRELDRIQELRQKQEMSSKTTDSHQDMKTVGADAGEGPSRILNPQQMAEISRLLSQVKQQSDPNSSHVMELLELLKHTQGSGAVGAGQQRGRGEPRGRAGAAPVGAQHRGKAHPGPKKNVQFNPTAKSVEGPKPNPEVQKSQGDKQTTKAVAAAVQPAKKVERKVAGSASKADKGPGSACKADKGPGSACKADKGPKPAAWK